MPVIALLSAECRNEVSGYTKLYKHLLLFVF